MIGAYSLARAPLRYTKGSFIPPPRNGHGVSYGPQQQSGSCSNVPNIAIAAYAPNRSQNDVGNCYGLCSSAAFHRALSRYAAKSSRFHRRSREPASCESSTREVLGRSLAGASASSSPFLQDPHAASLPGTSFPC